MALKDLSSSVPALAGGWRQAAAKPTPATHRGESPRANLRYHLARRPAVAVEVEGEDLTSLTVVQLKQRLRELGLPVSGRKDDLIRRLQGSVVRDGDGDASAEPAVGEREEELEEPEEATAEEPAEHSAGKSAKKQADPPPPWLQFNISMLGPLAKKEQSVLRFVQKRTTRGDLASVLAAIERFAEESSWLKVAGGSKGRIFEGSMRPGDRVVEMGTFVGYSSMRMGQRLRALGGGGHVTSCEVDAATAMVARAIIDHACATQEVRVRVGRGGDWIATGQLGSMDLLILDHRGTKYHEDLLATESSLAASGARVVADNVFYPGAPLFLNVLEGRYNATFHDVHEFLQPEIDDWIVICEPPPLPPGVTTTAEKVDPETDGWGPKQIARRPGLPPPGPAPPELRQWSAEVDAISWRSMKEDVDWLSFQAHIGPKLRAWKDAHNL